MFVARLSIKAVAFTFLVCCFAHAVKAQQRPARELRPDVRRALSSRIIDADAAATRKDGYTPRAGKQSLPRRARTTVPVYGGRRRLRPARIAAEGKNVEGARASAVNNFLPRISAGTPLSRVLHTSQLSNLSSAGSNEQLVDKSGNLEADERTTFDAVGGSFDIATGRSGARYEVYSAIDDRGTATTSDDRPVGVITLALDTNGDYVRDTSSTFDLERDFGLPSAVSVVSGTSKAGREFVVVSSSGYFNFDNSQDPANEPSAGVVLLVRDPLTNGFDNSRSRSLVGVGNNALNNANALALLPNNDLLIADFTSNELRIVRDTNADGIPDQLDPAPFYSYRFSNDAPLDIAANSRGIVFSHSFGNDTVLLAIYDDDHDGRGDADEVVVEGLSLDNNLILHGLTVDRAGTVYIIEDASGAADTTFDGGNGGEPRIDAFPDPALNGILRDGSIFFYADDPATQSLTGLSFGVELVLAPVRHLSLANAASLRPPATRDGLAAILGNGLTRGRSGRTPAEASARAVVVTIEGVRANVLSFDDSQINIHVPKEIALGANSIVVYVDGDIIAAADAQVLLDNPGLFTYPQTGTGEAIALLASGMRYTSAPFPSTFDGQPSVISLFGTGWRNALPVNVLIGGRSASVQYAGQSGDFPGLDQINFVVPAGLSGAAQVFVTTANGATSRTDVFVSLQ